MPMWLINCLLALIISAFCAGIVIPQILLIAFRKKLFDELDERKIHHSLVPRLGGIAFEPVIMFTLLLIVGINLSFLDSGNASMWIIGLKPFIFAFCALIIIYLVGMADDLIGVRYRAKFVAQIICAILMICGGVYVNSFHGVLLLGSIPEYIAWPFTILLIVFIVNAFNLIDGIDGLASGLSAIACLVYGVIYFYGEDYLYALLSFATCGVLLPFFYYNVFGNPEKQKKIFMGDTGALTIGMILSFLSIRMSMFTSTDEFEGTNIMVLAFSPLLIPCCDVVRVYLGRLRKGKNPFMPDRSHIHHKLLAAGMHQRTAMITIIATSLFLIVLNIWLSKMLNVNLILLIDIILWIAPNMWLSRRAASRNSL